MPHSALAIVFAVTMGAWGLVEAYALSRRPHGAARNADHHTRLMLVASSMLAFFVIEFLVHASAPGPSEWRAVGVGLCLLGLSVRIWAIATLGRFFTTEVMIQADQKVVDRGPYRWVRHPSYLGILLLFLGVPLAQGQPVGDLVMLVVFLPALTYRMAVEERTLVEALGLAYQEYQARTRRLIPFLL